MPSDQVSWIPQAMERNAGVSRNGMMLRKLEDRLLSLGASAVGSPFHGDGSEFAHQVLVARLVVRGALLRTESRGVHWRADATAAEGNAAYHLELSCNPDSQHKSDVGSLAHHICAREFRY
jgi:aspartate oxidase